MRGYEKGCPENQVGGVIVSESMEALKLALQFRVWPRDDTRFTGWWEETNPAALYLTTASPKLWADGAMGVYLDPGEHMRVKVARFLTPATDREVAELVERWLRGATYPQQGDGDGSWKKGFRVSFSIICTSVAFIIRPEWIFYGK